MTPNEQLIFILGNLLIEKGGIDYINELCKQYNNGLDRAIKDRNRLKVMLVNALKKAQCEIDK